MFGNDRLADKDSRVPDKDDRLRHRDDLRRDGGGCVRPEYDWNPDNENRLCDEEDRVRGEANRGRVENNHL
jgi:hypothetical protein